MLKYVAVGLACLLLGVALGIFLGRSMMEREWSQPKVLQKLTAAEAGRSTGKDADPAPKEGSLVLGPAPLARARTVMTELTAKDPLVLRVGAVGNGDEGAELHLALRNRGACQVTAFSGVAYGYDAYGRASKMNSGGEHYVAFSEEKVEDLGVGQEHLYAAVLHHADTASLALAQVDQFTCADGKKWARN